MFKRRLSLFRVFWDDLVSKRYKIVFSLSSVFTVAAFCIMRFVGDFSDRPLLIKLLLTSVVMLGVLGAVQIWFGMWSYWVRFDSSRDWTKRVWFVVLLIGVCFASILYFAAVYIPQVMAQTKGQNLQGTESARDESAMMRRLVRTTIGVWALFLMVAFAAPFFPKLVSTLRIGTCLAVCGFILLPSSVIVAILGLYRSGVRHLGPPA